ncbi:dihydroxyacetone kinase subunit DhaL [Photobacterium indicum]|jgi:phosphoenolpyruvate---glycerone phosphotransferase subunit DhaL|uniref:Dihydroxyacetone kinase subunit L n=1 Tax=Photobacterium indicum TaxID=81447 RepID=A0A2T3LDE4_9GAMM|nr:dihydroxyacetone kinase subunit DhaL [Photobacterium indicum]PSV49411.1 dihydroxyacetone kinase subunit L [Photobacterium indicum]
MTITKQQIVQWLEDSADVFQNEQDFLTELDREIGDADHGLNMNRGFQKVKEKLPSVADKDIGTILKTTGMTLLSSIGGASGPLYGTFFIRAATSVMSKEELNLVELTKMLQDGMDGIVQRGKAEVGDKTMIDTWNGIMTSLKQDQNISVYDALNTAVANAEVAMKSTIPMQARKGRASYLGERSIGHQDPGATSTYLLFTALRNALAQ